MMILFIGAPSAEDSVVSPNLVLSPGKSSAGLLRSRQESGGLVGKPFLPQIPLHV